MPGRRLLTSLIATLFLAVPAAAAQGAPVQIDLGATPSVYTEDAPATALFPDVRLSDPDSLTLSRAVVRLTKGKVGDEIGISDGSAQYDPLYRELVLTGVNTVEAWQERLRKVTFRSSAEDPLDPERTIQLVVDEAANQASRTLRMDVALINDVPAVHLNDSALSYTENQEATQQLDGDVKLFNAEEDTTEKQLIASVAVAITAGGGPGDAFRCAGDTTEDEAAPCRAALEHGIEPTWNAETRTLTFTGEATTEVYRGLLATVHFFNRSDNPGGSARTIRVTATDTAGGRGWDTRALQLTPVNDQAVLTGVPTHLTAIENSEPVLAPAAEVADPDTSIASATVTLGAGRIRGGDVLEYQPVEGSPVTGAFNAETGVLTLSGAAPAEAYAAALRRVQYADHKRDAAVAHAVSAELRVADLEGLRSEISQLEIKVEPVEDPVRIDIAGRVAWNEDEQPAYVAPTLQAYDPDTETLRTASVRITSGRQPGDELVLSGASWNASTATLTYSGTGTPAAYQNLLRRVTFRSTSDSPTAGVRTVVFTAGEGANTGSGSTTVAVVPVNDAPVVDLANSPLTYTEGSAGVRIDGSMLVSDPDDADATSAAVELVGTPRNGDILRTTAALPAGITQTYDAANRRLRFSGRASVTAYRDLLRTVEFVCEDGAPVTASRTVRVTVTDNGDPVATGSDTRRIDILSVNTPPTVRLPAEALSTGEGAAAVPVAPELGVIDPDDTTVRSATVALSGYERSREELAAGAMPPGLSAAWDAGAGRLTISGAAALAAYEQALRSVTYRYTGDAPSSAPKAAVVTVFDGQSEGTARRGVQVAGVNDAPSLQLSPGPRAMSIAAAPEAIDPTLDVVDPDSPELGGARVEIEPGTGDLALSRSFAGITATWDTASGRLTLTGSASAETYRSALRAVTYRTLFPGDRSATFLVSDGQLASAPATRAIKAGPGSGTGSGAGVSVGVKGETLPMPPAGASVDCRFDRGVLNACEIRLVGLDGTPLGSGARAGEGPVRIVLNRTGRARLALRPLGMPVKLDVAGSLEEGTVLRSSERTYLVPQRPAAMRRLFAGRTARLSAAGRKRLAVVKRDAAPLERVTCVVTAASLVLARRRALALCAALKRKGTKFVSRGRVGKDAARLVVKA